MRVGILHPGVMGSAMGSCLRQAGHATFWASGGRSDESRRRAARDHLEDVGTVEALVTRCDLLISICPSAAALPIAEAAAAGFQGTYVDANAISRRRFEQVATAAGAAGARVVDGSVIGPPPRTVGTTRLYMAGSGAHDVAALFEGTALSCVVLDGPAGQASALKMCYAAETKGWAALTVLVRLLAEREGVEEDLLSEWERSRPQLTQRSVRAAESGLAKGPRWADEMLEIGDAMADRDLPRGVHDAAASVFAAIASNEDALRDVLEQWLEQGPTGQFR